METTANDPTAPRPRWAEVAPLLDARFGGVAEAVATRDVGAWSPAGRWIARLGDGSRAFVKADRDDRAGVAGEASTCAHRWGPFQPAVRAFLPAGDDGIAVLVAEDLSAARWGVPLTRSDVVLLAEALDALALIDAPEDLPAITDRSTITARHWLDVAADPEPVLATGLVDARWLDASAATLAGAAGTVDVAGDGVVHGDPWRQNWCIAGRGAVLVDWMSATRGNPELNHAWGECAVRACEGPEGIVLGPGHPRHAGWAAWMAGLTVRFLTDDLPRRQSSPALWATQARECHAALRWASDALGIDLPVAAPGAVPAGPWRP